MHTLVVDLHEAPGNCESRSSLQNRSNNRRSSSTVIESPSGKMTADGSVSASKVQAPSSVTGRVKKPPNGRYNIHIYTYFFVSSIFESFLVFALRRSACSALNQHLLAGSISFLYIE